MKDFLHIIAWTFGAVKVSGTGSADGCSLGEHCLGPDPAQPTGCSPREQADERAGPRSL